MDKRCGSWLLPMAALLFPLSAMAQIPSLKQSHRELPGELDLGDPQEMMSQRLREVRALHGLQDQVQGLLKDPSFLNNLKQFSEPELQRLREKMLKGEGLGQDRDWNRFLQQAQSNHKLKVDLLRRWAERAEVDPSLKNNLLEQNGLNPLPPPNTGSNGSGESPSSPAREMPEPPWFERMQDESTKWFVEQLDDMGGEVLNALLERGGREDAPLAELMRTLRQADFSAMNDERIAELSRHLPNIGELLREQRGVWDEVRSIFRNMPTTTLPNHSLSKPPSSPSDAGVWMPVILSLLIAVSMVVLILGARARRRARAGLPKKDEWRLGSWPMSPNQVSTRHDLVLAFEYVALLCLGVVAGTCHHRALAERLAAQDCTNPARRHAAETLAWLYEQARYAPPGESLSQEELIDARHALRLLAGVTTV